MTLRDDIEKIVQDFEEAASTQQVVAAQRAYQTDCDTPLALFARVRGLAEPNFLLESAEGGEKWARHSVFGVGALVTLDGRSDGVVVRRTDAPEEVLEPGFEAIRLKLEQLAPTRREGAQRFFGGFVGFISYDAVRYFEDIPDRHGPDAERFFRFVLPEAHFIFDNFHSELRVVVFAGASTIVSARGAAHSVVERLDEVEACLLSDGVAGLQRCLPLPGEPVGQGAPLQSNCARQTYLTSVERAKEYIRAGDVFQVVLSQRFSIPDLQEPPLDVYRRLRIQNPSPYLFFLSFDDETLIGASPEVMVRLDGDLAELRPIAGTAPRGETYEEDMALEAALLADPKECAEHVMLIDLGRNDLGKVCEVGSIEIPEQMVVERYSKVMHIVSHVRGRLAAQYDWLDLLGATFPAGTLTGAPKIRAMEIIDELEPDRRGVYGGAVGFIGFDGNIDFCITIRTIHVANGRYSVQVGAGIVADSDPLREFEETVNKARAMLRVIGAEVPPPE